MRELLDIHWDDLSTKADFAELRGEFAELRGDFAGLEGKFAGLQTDVTDLRSEMRVGFARVDTRFAEMNAKLERQLRVQLIWLIATLLTITAILVARG